MAKQSSIAKTSSRVAFWLLPDEKTLPPFSTTIEQLSAHHGGPVFEPHVTIACEALSGEITPGRILDELAAMTDPIDLKPLGFDAEDSFTKSLFLRYAQSTGLLAMRRRVLEQAFPRSQSPVQEPGFDPHLSLMYAALPLESRRGLARSFDPSLLQMCPHRFDRVQAISVPGPVESARDVESWKLLAEKSLIRKTQSGRNNQPSG